MVRTMCDIHMHLIPGVDDGALDMDMALCMTLQAYEQGISEIIATPHSSAFRMDAPLVSDRFSRLRDRAAYILPDMKLCLGCEVYCDSSHMAAVLANLHSGCYPTMNGTNYVLTEFSQWTGAEQALHCVDALLQNGWKPILAHLERYENLCLDWNTAERFRQMGCLVQINTYSLQEEGNTAIKSWARELVRKGWVDFLGTDAHRTYHRPPSAASGLAWIYANCEQAYADRIVRENAKELLIR